jgi:GNAT superfamily N-acetyltransferase
VTDPRNYEAAGRLKDGTPVVIRAIHHDDAPGILAGFKSMDPEAVYTRFFTYQKGLTDTELRQITDVDFERVVALVVTAGVGKEEKLIGGGRYFADVSLQSAELAFVTGDDYRGQGIASLVLRHLAGIGRARGVLWFEADVLAQNHAMLAVFRRSGLPIRERPEGNVIHVTLSLDPPSSS